VSRKFETIENKEMALGWEKSSKVSPLTKGKGLKLRSSEEFFENSTASELH